MYQLFFKENLPKSINPELRNRMEKIARKVIRNTKFFTDFYYDLQSMQETNIFVWFVYDCGTNFIPFTEADIYSFQNEWLSSIDVLKELKNEDPSRLYLCNLQKDSLIRIRGFKTGDLYHKLLNLL